MPPANFSNHNKELCNLHPTTSSEAGSPALDATTTDRLTVTRVQSPTRAPPKLGFVPRENTIVDQIRNDIRRTQLSNGGAIDALHHRSYNQLNMSSQHHLCSVSVESSSDSSQLEKEANCRNVVLADSSVNYHPMPVPHVTLGLSNKVDDRSRLELSPGLNHQHNGSAVGTTMFEVTHHRGIVVVPKCRGWERHQDRDSITEYCTCSTQHTYMSSHNSLQSHKDGSLRFQNSDNFQHTLPAMEANSIQNTSSTDDSQFDSLRAEPELKCY